jgi:hypothetical protein
MQQTIALGLQLVRGGRDVGNLELDAGLGNGDLAGPVRVPKQAIAASDNGQSPKCFVPGSSWVYTYSPPLPSNERPRAPP